MSQSKLFKVETLWNGLFIRKIIFSMKKKMLRSKTSAFSIGKNHKIERKKLDTVVASWDNIPHVVHFVSAVTSFPSALAIQ